MTKMGSLINKITMSVSAPALNSRLIKHVLRSFQMSFDDTQNEFDFKRSSPDPRAIDYLRERVITLSEKTADRLKGNLKYELVEGMKNAESITQIKQRIKPIFNDMEDYELERLARNEVMDSLNEGRMEAYRDDGDVRYKVWRAALKDKRTADDSKRLAGQIQPVNNPFVDPETGKTCDHPPNRPNCRCGTVPLEELPDDIVYRGELMYHPSYMYGAGGESKKEAPELTKFKNKLSGMDDNGLKKQVEIVMDNYPTVRKVIVDWYKNYDMPALDIQLSELFGMPEKSSRQRHAGLEELKLDPDTTEGYMKIYLTTQEYLKRTDPDGRFIAHRGLGSHSYQRFKDLAPGEDIELEQYNISSWTVESDVAEIFAELSEDGGVLISTNIPTKRIFIHPDCAPAESGDFGEGEVIIMGSKIDAQMGDVFEPIAEEEELD